MAAAQKTVQSEGGGFAEGLEEALEEVHGGFR